MKHPKGLILDVLAESGAEYGRIHDAARRIQAAYDEANADRGEPMEFWGGITRIQFQPIEERP